MNEATLEILRRTDRHLHQVEHGLPFAKRSGLVLFEKSEPTPNDLNDRLNQMTEAPGASTIITVPKKQPTTPSENNDINLIMDARTVDALVSVLTAVCMYQEHAEPFNLASKDEARAFVDSVAKWKNYVLTGGAIRAIPMYLSLSQASTTTVEKKIKSTELHTELLSAIFAGLGLPQAQLTELDAVLTEIADGLRKLQLDYKSDKDTLNHFLSYYYLKPFEGSNPPINEMHCRFVFLQLSGSTWAASVQKGDTGGSISSYSLDMTLTTTDAILNQAMVQNNSLRIASTLSSLTAGDAKQIAQLTGVKAVIA